ncbi:MAG TPA: transglutaminase family protein [Paracoccaceae bacterium]|nr:transglutaminase family protein [Paracoccaceae bacterium]HMO71558.1 transglutaminase family protein [Paracoccaceae bacterium]
MLIRFGFDICIDCAAPTPLVCRLAPEAGRVGDLVQTPFLSVSPGVEAVMSADAHGNLCHRLVAPAGSLALSARGLIRDTGAPDPTDPAARELAPQDIPSTALHWTLPSRYVESDLLSPFAWDMFGGMAPGWGRVQAVSDWVHGHLAFDYQRASVFRTAQGALHEGTGVCRDYAHLTLAILRALNIPARYVNGYLGDIGVPPVPDPMDFAAWIEVLLATDGGPRWMTFDPRNNARRIGRVVVARGHDAADVPLVHSFGPHVLTGFRVICEEEPAQVLAA